MIAGLALVPATLYAQSKHFDSISVGQYAKIPKLKEDVTVTGTTPKITIGDTQAEDTMLAFDGNAQDFHLALDDSSDKLVIGLGTTAGTTERITFNSGDLGIILGDATAADVWLLFDGIAQDFYIGIDDGTDDLIIGSGSAVGTTPAITIDENQDVTFTQAVNFAAQFSFGTETVTTDAQDPGTGTASASVAVTVVVSDATGGSQDAVTLPDGTVAGQVKIFILGADLETSGTVIAPTSVVMTGGAGTSTLLEDVGDTVSFTWGGANWYLTGNIGGTVQ